MELEIQGSPFRLLQEKAMFNESQHLLVIADVHLGKAAHFRKAGIAIPTQAQDKDYLNLTKLLQTTVAKRVYFLGDLFHSKHNYDWDNFQELIARFPKCRFTLIRGNHDIIDNRHFEQIGIAVVDKVEEQGILFTHEPQTDVPLGTLNVSGHIHPGFRLQGSARQSVMLPCFYLTESLLLLPAFGALTGLVPMANPKGSSIFLVTPQGVIKWQQAVK
jgi:uncharacterized protein